MKRYLGAVCVLVLCVVNTFAQCPFAISAGPDTTICANQSAYLHGSVNPAGAYTYQWAPSATLTGSTTLTPTATPSVTTAYTLSVTGGGCTATATVNVNVSGSALILSATIAPSTPVCPGTLEQLNASIVPNVCGISPPCTSTLASAPIGSGVGTQTGGPTAPPTIMGNWNNSGRNQMLYTSTELAAVLGGACTIDGVGFDIGIFNSYAYLQNFTISIACTNQTSLSTFDNNLTQVLGGASIQPSLGWNDFAFSSAYNWDGVSNLIVDICWNDPGLNGSQNNKAVVTSTAPNNTLLYAFSNTADMCGTNVAPTASPLRPNARFGYCKPNIDQYPIQWTPAIGANAVNKPDSSDPTSHPVTSQLYTVAVTNGTCVATATVNAVVDTSHVSTGPNISSCPGAAVTLTATAVGTVLPGPAAFTWTTVAGGFVGNGATQTVHPVANTAYVVEMTGGACPHYDTVNVTLGSLNVVAVPTNVTCTNLNNGKIVVTASNGTTPYTYTWNAAPNPGNSNTAPNLGPGTYTVTVSDVNTCSGTATAVITQPAAALTNSSIVTTKPLCNGGNNGIITVTPSGGTKPYTYIWSPVLPADSMQTGLVAGTYNLTTTDANGCMAVSNIILSQPSAITFGAAIIQNVACAGQTTGQITVSPTGGTGAYTYRWSQSATLNSPTAMSLNAGTYTVTVTDANACTATASNTVSAAMAITFNAPTAVNANCFGASDGSATVNPAGGTTPYTYLWTPSNQTTNPATGLSAQTYTVVVTDNNHCTASSNITISQPGAIVIIADSTNVSCNGGSNGTISITGTTNAANPVTYAWSNMATTQNLANLSSGPYSVIVKDANGCTAARTFNITQPTALVINNPTQVNDVCLNGATGSLTANASGGTGAYRYLWSNTATTQTISNLEAGAYGLTVADANLCTATASYTITQPLTGPSFLNVQVSNESCNGGANGSIAVNVTGGTPGYTYAWSPNSQTTTATATGLAEGTYTVTATDAGGCSIDTSNTISQPSAISFGVPVIDNVSCNGGHDGSVLFNPSGGSGGGYTFTWGGVAGTNPEPNLAAGTYTVIITDGSGCTASSSVTVNQPAPILDSIERNNVRCNGGNDGSLEVFAYGGNAPYTYLWGDGSTTQLDSGLSVQQIPYSVAITDSKGCSAADTASLTQPPVLIFTHSETQDSCFGFRDGTISCAATGGTPPYSFSVTKDFSNVFSTTNGIVTQLDSGLYYIVFSDNNGCIKQDTAFIKSPVADTFSISVDSTLCPGYNDGSIFVTALTLSNTPYTYSIDGSTLQDTSYFGGLAAGLHHITAINQFGCPTALDTTVGAPGPAFAAVLPADTTLQLGQSIILQSGFGPYPLSSITSYNWVPSAGLSCIDCPAPAATPYSHVNEYVLTITYNGVCMVSDSMQIIVVNQSKPFIPNSFSPNGDGNNDVFQIYGEDIKTVNLRIFNRWGELVFESTNQFNGWDGTYKGVLQMPGVFTYEAQITFLDDTQVQKHGSITLIR